ncbi:MAG: S-layer homology domain-containing protein [Bacillota bacterium]|jgi:Ni/Co efflux regulator RcnB
MKKILLTLLAVAFLVSSTAPVADAAQFGKKDKQKANQKVKIERQLKAKFKDVKGHWAEDVLLAMTAKGYLQGYQDASFKPSNNVSELEAVVMIVRALGLEDEAKEAKLSTVVKHAKQIPSWAQGYVQVAYEEGILTQGDLASFNPNKPAKRIKVAQMITRALNLTDQQNNRIAVKFLDQKDIPQNFTGIVVIMVLKCPLCQDTNFKI